MCRPHYPSCPAGGIDGSLWCCSVLFPRAGCGNAAARWSVSGSLQDPPTSSLPGRGRGIRKEETVLRERSRLSDTSWCSRRAAQEEGKRGGYSHTDYPILSWHSSRSGVTIPCLSAKDSSYMGKRLEQQPMYPQYTYYYPHYLQTKVRRYALLMQALHTTLPPPAVLSSLSGHGV
uniref:Uncharacterized protein n=1 Tax=Knipowitschia caucasica TaxID=637954 RepID=A0AAV2K7F2_KNICA